MKSCFLSLNQISQLTLDDNSDVYIQYMSDVIGKKNIPFYYIQMVVFIISDLSKTT